MGDPAIPDAIDRDTAIGIARGLLDYIRNDRAMPPLDDSQLWLMASTLVWQAERIKEIEGGLR